jgi:glycosyltransferase involved in cell wall biosynthesis
MKIDVYTWAWNEEKVLPFFLDHYSSFCNTIYVVDNESTDSSHDIYAKYPKVKVIKNTSKSLDDINLSYSKSTLYRELSRGVADWSIIVDVDEFLYHPNLLSILEQYKKEGVQVPKVKGFDMISETLPEYKEGSSLLDQVKTGCYSLNYSKPCIVDTNYDITYGLGCHPQNTPIPHKVKRSEREDLKLLHYKNLGFNYIYNRFQLLNSRRSERNKQFNFGSHYTKAKETIEKEFNTLLNNSEIVI